MMDKGLKENVRHGTEKFPLKIYESEHYHKNSVMLHIHWHEEIELMVVTKGEMQVITNGEAVFAKKDTVLLFPPNILHGGYQVKGEACGFVSIVFHPDFIASKHADTIQDMYLTPFFNNGTVPYYILRGTDRENRAVNQLIHDFRTVYRQEPLFGEMLLKGYLYQIVTFLFLGEAGQKNTVLVNPVSEKRKKKVIQYIEENYRYPLSLDKLSASVSLSKEQFCRFFRQSFYTTPIQYVNQYRILQASRLLKETDMPVIQVAVEVGYESSSYFSVMFKRLTGKSPKDFRKMT